MEDNEESTTTFVSVCLAAFEGDSDVLHRCMSVAAPPTRTCLWRMTAVFHDPAGVLPAVHFSTHHAWGRQWFGAVRIPAGPPWAVDLALVADQVDFGATTSAAAATLTAAARGTGRA